MKPHCSRFSEGQNREFIVELNYSVLQLAGRKFDSWPVASLLSSDPEKCTILQSSRFSESKNREFIVQLVLQVAVV